MRTLFTVLTIIGFVSKFCHSDNPPHISTLDEIYEEVKGYAKRFSILAHLTEIGRTYENRPIYCLVIHDRSNPSPDTTVLLEFGIHAREWASPASALFLIRELLINTGHRRLIREIKWIIIPVMNPDGYHYSTQKSNFEDSEREHKFWRKNRRPIKKTQCVGVDLNRNYPVGYSRNYSRLSSACEEIYGGPKPLSEPETQAMDELLSTLGYVDAYVAVHACSQSILHPYGYKMKKPGRKFMKVLLKAARLMKKAMKKVAGTNYKVQSAAELYIAGGASDDYAFEYFNIPVVYTLELGYDSEDDEECFHPGPKEMEQLQRECLAAFLALGDYLVANVRELHRVFDPYARKTGGSNNTTGSTYCITIIMILVNILLVLFK